MDEFTQLTSCFTFMLFIVSLVICIVLAIKMTGLRERVEKLERRLAEANAPGHQGMQTRPATPAARTGTESREMAPSMPPTASPVSMPNPYTPVAPPASSHVPPPLPTPPRPISPPATGHATTERLLGRLEEIKQKAPTADAARGAEPPPAAPPAPAPRPASPRPPAKKRSVEFYVISAFIVVAAIAVSIAVILLVKMGIDAGKFGPLQRDWAGGVAALGLIAVGQWRRRREGFWSQGLTAAGIVSLFASLVAATSVHHFLTPIEGFLLLALTTAGAVGMSLQDWSGTFKEGGKSRGGMLIATLGLVGGFLTPALVNSGHDDVPGLFGYLILLHIGLVFATRIRGWTVLAAASVVLSSVWLMLWVAFKWDPVAHPQDGTFLGLFMLAAAASLVFSTIRSDHKWRGGPAGAAAMMLTWLGVALGMLSACLLLGKSQFDNLQWAFFATLVAGAFVLARLRRPYEPMAWLASATVLAMLAVWGVGIQHLPGTDPAPAVLAQHAPFTLWLLGFGVATVLAAFACQWKHTAPVRWAVLANLLAVAYVAVGYWLVPALPRADAWGLLPLAAGGGLAILMGVCLARRERMPQGEVCLTAYGHGILALLLMAAPMGLSGSAQTAAWAALLPVVALAMWRLKLPGLAGGFLITAGLVAVRGLMIASLVDAGGAGRTLWWNPVVWTYGSMILSMAAAAWLLERCGELSDQWRHVVPGPKALASLMLASAATAAFILLSLEVRWGFHDGKLDANSALLAERGSLALGWLLLAAALIWIGKQLHRHALTRVGEVVAMLGSLYAVVVLVVITNPLWWLGLGGADDVGAMPVLNLLLFAYGLPAAACGLLVFVLRRYDDENKPLAQAVAAVGVLLLFMLVSLEVRQEFVGAQLTLALVGVSFRELATYGTAWLALAAACLAIGRRWEREVLWQAGVWIGAGAVMYVIAVVGILMSPVLQHEDVGTWKLANDVLYAYGAPLALACLLRWLADPRAWRFFRPLPTAQTIEGGTRLAHLMKVAMISLLFILVSAQVRQWFQGDFLDRLDMPFLERGTYGVVWLLLSGGLLAIGYGLQSQTFRRGGLIVAGVALAWALGVVAVLTNPLWTEESVGATRIFNGLLYAYGLPAIGAGALSLALWKQRRWSHGAGMAERVMAWVAGIISLVLVFVLVTLQVQHWFRGDHLALAPAPPGTPAGEFLTYTLAWALLGFVYLMAGLWQKSALLRWASLVMMLITIPKVFLLDLAGLRDFQRVLSFAGLGVALMALGFFYYRFVFQLAPPPGETGETPPEEAAVIQP